MLRTAYMTFALASLFAVSASPLSAGPEVTSNITSSVSLSARQEPAYAYFYDDTACTTNQGAGVNIYNPGCLNESGRGSVMIPFGTYEQMCLVKSPDPDCNCQKQSYDFKVPTNAVNGAYCEQLDPENVGFNSFRFIGGSCGGNNCP